MINNIPQSFVKQFGKFEKIEANVVSNNISNSKDISKTNTEIRSEISSRERNCLKLLHLAQIGDKEHFLDILEMYG